MGRGQIWQNFPQLLRFMALFPSLKKSLHKNFHLEVSSDSVVLASLVCQVGDISLYQTLFHYASLLHLPVRGMPVWGWRVLLNTNSLGGALWM